MLCLSVGENCMPQAVLERFGVQNTWNTPYSNARSNIRYAIEYEKESYKSLLNNKYITKFDNTGEPNLWRNVKYINNTDCLLFEKSVSNGFEFTHHNIIHDSHSVESYKRKIQRMIDLRTSNEDLVFFYHHRYLNEEPLDKIIEYCNTFANMFDYKNRKCHIILMRQKIIAKSEERKIVTSYFEKCILCDFYTRDIWRGNDESYVFAEIDDDLFVQMFKKLYSMNILDDIGFIHNYHLSIFYFLQNDFNNMCEAITNNLKVTDKQKIYFWGAGQLGIFLSKKMSKIDMPLTAIIDNDIKKQSNLKLPIPIIPFSKVEINSKILITSLSRNAINDIIQQIKKEYNEITITMFEYESFSFFCVTLLDK